MKWMIASDIHGSAYWCEKLLEQYKKEGADRLLLLGDLLYHGPRNDLPREYHPKAVIEMLNSMKSEITCVRGNCEAEVDQMVLPFPCMADYALLHTGKELLYLTHGHLWTPDSLPLLEPGTVFLSGHTHVKLDEIRGGIRCVNPGSVSIPKDGSHSCAVYSQGEFSVRILEG